MSKQVRLGIIGLGQQGGMYAKFITDGHGAEHGDRRHLRHRPGQGGGRRPPSIPTCPSTTTTSSMLDSGDVDAVVTCVPHYLHPEMGIDALQRDIHALVEKPAGVYTKQVKELNEFAATKPELTFAIMFNQRNNPLYQQLKEIVDNGEIGGIRRTNWIITTWWRPQGYYDRAHGAPPGAARAAACWSTRPRTSSTCGSGSAASRSPSTPRSPTGSAATSPSRTRSPRVVDYGDGATGVFVTATHDLVGTDRFEILGDQGKIVVENSKTATVTRLRQARA